jgi:hemerythrin
MKIIEWKQEYSIGVKIIDEQHQKFFSLINDLNIAISERQFENKIIPVLDALIEYTDYHFKTEEKYFDEFSYEFADEHRAQHDGFEKKIKQLVGEFKNKEIEISFDLIDYMEDWLIEHIAGEDRKYIKCFKENGLK